MTSTSPIITDTPLTSHILPNVTDTRVGVLLSDDATTILQWVIDTVICQLIDIFGIGTNIINIMCFIKQGFKDSVNVSLFGLAIADLGSLITLFGTNIFLTPAFSSSDLPFVSAEVMYLTTGLSHVTCSRISEWITALITLERCLCITAPLKISYHCLTTGKFPRRYFKSLRAETICPTVKNVVTPKRVSVVIISMFIIIISSVTPIYVVNRLDFKFVAEKNKTLLGIVYTEYRGSMENIFYIINNVLIPFLAFLIIIICTVILVIKLQKASQWRKESCATTQGDNVTKRNQKATRMVLMISLLFIVCFVPLCLVYFAMSLVPELSISGKHKNILIIVAGFAVILESINASSNIFIYYYMSSNYKSTFCKLFGRTEKS